MVSIGFFWHTLQQHFQNIFGFLAGAGGAVVGNDTMLQHGQRDFAHLSNFRRDFTLEQREGFGAQNQILGSARSSAPFDIILGDPQGAGAVGTGGSGSFRNSSVVVDCERVFCIFSRAFWARSKARL